MGVRIERLKYLKYKKVFDSLQFQTGKRSFRMIGKLHDWGEVELVARIFYKKLENLLYTSELSRAIYDRTIYKLLKKNNLLEKNILEIIQSRDYHMEAINIFILKIFDFVYYTVKKKLPYIRIMSLITNAVSELLENTYKYTDRNFCITVGISQGQFPLIIKIENNYKERTEKVEHNLVKLKKGIEEVNSYADASKAFAEIMKKRVVNPPPNKKESRLGFAKIRVDTNAKIYLDMTSKYFGSNGVSLSLFVPMSIVSPAELEKKVEELIKA